jgi:fatty acid desaturase
MEVELSARLNRLDWLWAFTLNVPYLVNAIRTTARHSLGILSAEWERRIFPDSDPQLRRQMANWARVILFGHAALAATFVYLHEWVLLLLVTFAPFIAGWLNMLCAFPQHAGLTPDVPDFRLSCRTMILSPFVSFLYWRMNYHLEHHMYLSVPFYNLPKLRATIESDLPAAPRGLWASWKELLSVLRLQKADPTYTFVPILPDRADDEDGDRDDSRNLLAMSLVGQGGAA